MKRTLVILLAVNLFAATALGYGPRGHGLVGAIADQRIAKNQALHTKINDLLDGLTLQRVATLPDEIKTWDSNPNGFHLFAHKKLEAELRAFVAANPNPKHGQDNPPGVPSHHYFHYTDVPVFKSEQYSLGRVGTSNFDIVQMIPFCIRVLRGDEPANNDRKITKSVALILLVHYLGDIHQPLHVGAEYFEREGVDKGRAFDPSTSNPGFADQGGGKLMLSTLGFPDVGKFHSYWDGQTVENAFGPAKQPADDLAIAKRLAKKEPMGWQLSGSVDTWAEQLANEILPISREAHTRLEFSEIKIAVGAVAGKDDIKSGNVKETKKVGGQFYANWAADTVKTRCRVVAVRSPERRIFVCGEILI